MEILVKVIVAGLSLWNFVKQLAFFLKFIYRREEICFCSSDSLSTCLVLTCLLSIFLYELKRFLPILNLNLISVGLESSLQTIEYA